MRQPRRTLYAYFLRDVSGEWLLRADTNRGALIRQQRIDAKSYEVTTIETFALRPGESHGPLTARRLK
jgi:hypothetical protein